MRPRLLAPLLLLALLLAGLESACGIKFSDGYGANEFFTSIRLEGRRVAGAELVLSVIVNNTYQVPVQIACLYEDDDKLTRDQKKLTFEERATRIGAAVLQPVKDARPGDKVAPQALSFRFSVPEPGRYFLSCLTPAAPDNGFAMEFTLAAPGGGASR